MKFLEYLKTLNKLTPGIDYGFNAGGTVTGFTPGFIDALRAWNTVAILNPNKCEDVVVWEKNAVPRTIRNPLRDKKATENLMNNIPLDLLFIAKEDKVEVAKEPVEDNSKQDGENTEENVEENTEGNVEDTDVHVPDHAK